MCAAAAEMSYTTDERDDSGTNAGRIDRVYFLHVWALMITGIVFVFSASFPMAGRPDALLLPGNPYHYLVQHSSFVAVALVVMLLASRVPVKWLRSAALPLFGGGLVLLALTLLSPWGVTLGGARRWFDPPGLPMFQPSELMKVAFILLLAHLIAKKDEGTNESWVALGWAMIVTVAMGGILLLQRDQGMATIYAAIAFAMLLFSGMSLWKLVPMALGGLGVGLLIAHHEPYRWRRIIAFLDPENAPPDDRYHILNMLIAQARGGVTGTGLGMSPDKWHSLPAPHTDSIFSVIGCEMGLIGALVVLAAMALLTWRGMKIARGSDGAFGFYVAAGVSAMLCLQSIAHIAVNTSCMPVTGLTLPFISGGGTSLISAAAAAGIVLAISRHQRSGET